jgi:hypothetical protein
LEVIKHRCSSVADHFRPSVVQLLAEEEVLPEEQHPAALLSAFPRAMNLVLEGLTGTPAAGK